MHNETTEYLDDATMDRLLTVLDDEIAKDNYVARIVRLVTLTGARKGEIENARWIDYDASLGVLLIPKPKERKPKRLILSAEARAFIDSCPKRGQWIFCNPDGSRLTCTIYRARRIKQLAGLPDTFRPVHSLRHTAATRAVVAGVPLAVVSRMLGHSKTSMTDRYLSIADVQLRAAAEAVSTSLKRPE